MQVGDVVVARGPVVEADGCSMFSVEPEGFVDVSCFEGAGAGRAAAASSPSSSKRPRVSS